MTGVHTALRGLTYSGDTKHFTFDKYVTNHVNQHNTADRLTDYGAAKLDGGSRAGPPTDTPMKFTRSQIGDGSRTNLIHGGHPA